MTLAMLLAVSLLAVALVYAEEGDTPQQVCAGLQGGALLIPHPTACQRYFNCSNTALPEQFSQLAQYEDECPYSQVFDVRQKGCVSFKEGYCGPGRVAALDPCDYLKNRCGTAHCESCSSRLPSCVGLSDGAHEHPLKPWTPYFITCDTERLASVQTCGNVDPSRRKVIFSPIKNKCVTPWEVPRQFGGLAPSCDSRAPGQYRTPENAAVYYSCPSGQVFYCETGFQFNETSQTCQAAN
jgi:hypothetical protein